MGKFILTEEDKKQIRDLYSLNEEKSIEDQVKAELERLGYSEEDDVKVIMDDEPDNLTENIIKKAIVICSIAAGIVSCSKPESRYIYQYSYQTESSQEYSKKSGVDVKTTNFVPFDHRLSDSEVQQYKQQYDNKQNQTGDELINSELKLYAIDTEGEWG
jgi:hypothetical protein